MWVYPNPSRKEFLKNGGKPADEIDGPSPEVERFFIPVMNQQLMLKLSKFPS